MNRKIILFAVFSVLASGLNYLAYPLLARLLPSKDYVDITVALSLMTQLSTFMASLTALTIGLTKDGAAGRKLITDLQTSLLQIFGLLGLTFLLAAPLIMPAIQTPTLYAIPIVVMIIISIPINIISGYLNGRGLMVQLGLVAMIVSSSQFLIGAIAALSTRSGLATMLCMGLIQLVSLAFLIVLFHRYNLPQINRTLMTIKKHSKKTQQILVFTFVASVGIMAINLLQVLDLLLVKAIGGQAAELYTNIYVISRVIFFAGTIFIWPFLSTISPDDLRANRRTFIKLVVRFGGMTAIALFVLLSAGSDIATILFGQTRPMAEVRYVLGMSVLYKSFFLIIAAASLYLTVLRSYRAALLAIITVAVLAVSTFFYDNSSMHSIVTVLAMASGLCACIAIFFVMQFNRSTHLNIVSAAE